MIEAFKFLLFQLNSSFFSCQFCFVAVVINATVSLVPAAVDELKSILFMCAPVLLFICIAETAYAITPAFFELSPDTMESVLIAVLACWFFLTIAALTAASTLFASRRDVQGELWRIMKIMIMYIFVVGYISASSMALTMDVNDFRGPPEIGRHILLAAMLVEIVILAATAIVTRCVVTAFVGCCILVVGLIFFCTVVAIAFIFSSYGSVALTRRVLLTTLLIEVFLFGLFMYRRYSVPQPRPAEEVRPAVQPRSQGGYVALLDDACTLPPPVEAPNTPPTLRHSIRYDDSCTV